ncbi:interleukin-12 subunit beta, partial [Clinocottus analis]|uniref:interleukin-12 subunit beta n=1 Tax=Clinocottus analis TaxID=304258 RepID=UPI0035C0AE77
SSLLSSLLSPLFSLSSLLSSSLLLLLFLLPQKTSSLWVCGLLFVSLTVAHGLDHFPESYVVAKRNDPSPVTLTCRSPALAAAPGKVTWKFGDVAPEDATQIGAHLSVSEVDARMLGEYSCWRGNQKLSSTYLLMEAEEEEEDEEESDSLSISCRAKSYDCHFSCDWTPPPHAAQTAARIGLGLDCSEGRKSCLWFDGGRLADGRFHFELSHSLSPYAEESAMLVLTAEAIVDRVVVRTSRRFYLRDIVQPDSPHIVRCQEGEAGLNVSIDPPASWSSPHSFFSLEHEIEYVLKDDGQTGRSSDRLPKGISKLRARSRDPLVRSSWSQWTAWKNVITGERNLCKCKNAAKSCCPELPSGHLDNCKKRRKQRRDKGAAQSQAS